MLTTTSVAAGDNAKANMLKPINPPHGPRPVNSKASDAANPNRMLQAARSLSRVAVGWLP